MVFDNRFIAKVFPSKARAKDIFVVLPGAAFARAHGLPSDGKYKGFPVKGGPYDWSEHKINKHRGKLSVVGTSMYAVKSSVRAQTVAGIALQAGQVVCRMGMDFALPLCMGCCCSAGLQGAIISTALTQVGPEGADPDKDEFRCKAW